MGWITQEYDGNVHVVPDTEAGHVLAAGCFCEPTIEETESGCLITHRDQLDRLLDSQSS